MKLAEFLKNESALGTGEIWLGYVTGKKRIIIDQQTKIKPQLYIKNLFGTEFLKLSETMVKHPFSTGLMAVRLKDAIGEKILEGSFRAFNEWKKENKDDILKESG